MKKLILFALLLIPISMASITIDSPNPNSNCGFGTCEPIDIDIVTTGGDAGQLVYLTIEYDNSNGEIEWAKNFVRKGNKELELDAPFNLPAGNRDFEIKYFATGSGKFDVILKDIYGVELARLDPFWNSNFTYRRQFNLTRAGGLLDGFAVETIWNSTNMNMSHINAKGYAITHNASGTETRKYIWTELYDEAGNIKIWFNATADADGEIYYIYYGNTSLIPAFNPYSDHDKVFDWAENFDDEVAGNPPNNWAGNFLTNTINNTLSATSPNSLYCRGAIGIASSITSDVSFNVDNDIIAFKFYNTPDIDKYIRLHDAITGGGNQVVQLRIDNDGNIYYSDGVWKVIVKYIPNVWVDVEIEMDFTANTFDMRVNDTAVCNNCGFKVNSNQVLSILESMVAGGGVNLLDDGFWYNKNGIVRSFGSEEEQTGEFLNVTLNYPSHITTNTTYGNIKFGYTPELIGGLYANCSLWTNVSGAWANSGNNASSVVDSSINTISYKFSANTSIIWNVECITQTPIANFSGTNRTLTVVFVDIPEAPPIIKAFVKARKYQYPSGVLGIDVNKEVAELNVKELFMFVIGIIVTFILLTTLLSKMVKKR